MRLGGRFAQAGAAALIAVLFPLAAQSAGEFDKLVEMSKAELEKTGGELKIALDWTDSDAKGVMPAFQAAFPYIKKIDYERETGVGPFGRYLLSLQQNDAPPYDIMHIASEFEDQYWQAGAFMQPPFKYSDLNASRPSGWSELDPRAVDPEGERYLATTGNSRGIIYNTSLVKGDDIPKTWADCADPKWKGKVLMDARNKLQSLQYDPKTRDMAVQFLKDMKANDVVLVRGQAGLVNKVGAGEFPIACGVNYHTAFRSIEKQGVSTIAFVYPEVIAEELGTRLFVPKWSRTPATVQLFAFWVATEGQEAMGKSAYRGYTWNPKGGKYELAKGKDVALCEAHCALKWEEWNKEYADLLGIPYVKESD